MMIIVIMVMIIIGIDQLMPAGYHKDDKDDHDYHDLIHDYHGQIASPCETDEMMPSSCESFVEIHFSWDQ